MVFDHIQTETGEFKHALPVCPFCNKEIDRMEKRSMGASGRICYTCPNCSRILGVTNGK